MGGMNHFQMAGFWHCFTHIQGMSFLGIDNSLSKYIMSTILKESRRGVAHKPGSRLRMSKEEHLIKRCWCRWCCIFFLTDMNFRWLFTCTPYSSTSQRCVHWRFVALVLSNLTSGEKNPCEKRQTNIASYYTNVIQKIFVVKVASTPFVIGLLGPDGQTWKISILGVPSHPPGFGAGKPPVEKGF